LQKSAATIATLAAIAERSNARRARRHASSDATTKSAHDTSVRPDT
jgi:hypothetical protein